jgi:hypothetical protein
MIVLTLNQILTIETQDYRTWFGAHQVSHDQPQSLMRKVEYEATVEEKSGK